MRTIKELHNIINEYKFTEVDAHVHTHLCDGAKNMTIEQIAKQAELSRIRLVILTPHFHKQVSDTTATLYENSDEEIFLSLRDEIDSYHRLPDKKVKFLLSTETDINTTLGDISLKISDITEKALDLITPTINYHPELPLEAVRITSVKTCEEMHHSGKYKEYLKQFGCVSDVLETFYQAEVNALLKSPYPAMLGHFFAAHSKIGECNWFGAEPEHLSLMEKGAGQIIEVCRKTGAMIDLTGVHCPNQLYIDKAKENGYFYDFQKWFISQCRTNKIPAVPGSDAHVLENVGNVSYYRCLN